DSLNFKWYNWVCLTSCGGTYFSGKGDTVMHKVMRQVWFWGGFLLGLYVLLVISSVPMLGVIRWSGVHGIANNVGIRVLSTLVLMVISALVVWWIYRYRTDLWLRQVMTRQHVWWSLGAAALGAIGLFIVA